MLPPRDRSSKDSTNLPSRPSLLNQKTLWGVICFAAIAWSVQQTGIFSRSLFNPDGWALVKRFLAASLHPDLSPEFLWLTWHSTLTTLAYAVCGASLSVLVGMVGGVLASEVWWQSVFPSKRKTAQFQFWRKKFHRVSFPQGDRWPWLSIRAALSVPRAIHEIIWGLFFVNIFGLDPLTAILALAIPFGAITAKVFSEILDETPCQPLLSLLNSGVAPLSALTYGLLPQAFPNLLSYTFYRFECSIRAAAVLGIIGAGGLGYQILLSLQSLRYEQLWTLFFALFLLNGSIDFWSAFLRHRLGLANRLDLNTLNLAQRPSLHQHDSVVIGSWLGIALLLPFSFCYVQADVSKLWRPRTLQLLSGVSRTAWPPHLTGISITQLWELATQTLAMSILAMAIAGVGGILLSFPAAHNFFLPGGLLNPTKTSPTAKFWSTAGLLLTRFCLLISRAIPAPIWALMWLFILFPGILPGAIALGLHNLGILGRLMAEVTENLDEHPLKALKAQGAAATPIFLYGVLPPTLPRFIAYILYRWEVCIRETVIVGLVGAGGLGRLLTEQLSSFDYPGLLVTLSCFIALTFLVDLISATLRRALR